LCDQLHREWKVLVCTRKDRAKLHHVDASLNACTHVRMYA
jgi:hypothetical protein